MEKSIPRLEDDKILMIGVEPERDSLEMYKHMADEETLKWISNEFPESPEVTKQMLMNYYNLPDLLAWSIFLKETNELIGVYWLKKPFHLKYKKLISVDAQRIGRKFWRTGVTTRARKLVYEYAFRQLGVEEIHAGSWAENVNSCRSMEKAGFVLLEQHEDFFKNTGKKKRANSYFLTKEKWKQSVGFQG